MAETSFYADQPAGGANQAATKRNLYTLESGQLPVVSTNLDSVRSYQWEVRFDLTPMGNVDNNLPNSFTLGAKVVQGLGYSFQDIEVHRMNDRVYYPGKVQQEEVTITFDNLLTGVGNLQDPMANLHTYLSTVFDMNTGFYTESPTGTYKSSLKILEFDGQGKVRQVIELKGVYPKSFMKGEKNYSTSEFDTIEVKFRYDFMDVRAASLAGLIGL